MPALQVRQMPVTLEQVSQMLEQSEQVVVPSEKVPSWQATQEVVLTSP